MKHDDFQHIASLCSLPQSKPRSNVGLLVEALSAAVDGRHPSFSPEEQESLPRILTELVLIQTAAGASSKSPAGEIDWLGNLVRLCR